jgi:hypothetical protein
MTVALVFGFTLLVWKCMARRRARNKVVAMAAPQNRRNTDSRHGRTLGEIYGVTIRVHPTAPTLEDVMEAARDTNSGDTEVSTEVHPTLQDGGLCDDGKKDKDEAEIEVTEVCLTAPTLQEIMEATLCISGDVDLDKNESETEVTEIHPTAPPAEDMEAGLCTGVSNLDEAEAEAEAETTSSEVRKEQEMDVERFDV